MQKDKLIPALGYSWLNRFYDLTIRITMPEKKFRTTLLEYINPQIDQKILEFGFGTAQNLILFSKNYPNTSFAGVDIDPKIKAIAEKKIDRSINNIVLDLYNGNTLPYPNNYFDKIYSSLVFHHLKSEQKIKCLIELHRVLKPNGTLTIGDWGKPKNKLMRLLFLSVQLLDGFKTTNDNVKGLIPKFISKAGFKDVFEADYINTSIGTFSYYKSSKNEK